MRSTIPKKTSVSMLYGFVLDVDLEHSVKEDLIDFDESLDHEMVLIPAGEFMMERCLMMKRLLR